MPTVFVYEHCCAVGAGGSLGVEGRAMRDAVADDFRRLPGVTVLTQDGTVWAESRPTFEQLAERADCVLVVAPEGGGTILSELTVWLEEENRAMLSPGSDACADCADKLELARTWQRRGVPTPATWPLAEWPIERFPAVSKPRDGCGSEAINCIPNILEAHNLKGGRVSDRHPGDLIVQDYASGQASSVAFLVGPSQTVPLLPTFQHVSDDGRFRYLGGELPIPAPLAERAVALGRQAVGCVPGLRGYVGVDLVLGDAADGSRDYAIEINPRLTTSYVGLRALAETNLAGAMLDVCAGRPVEVRWKPGRVTFTPDGVVPARSASEDESRPR